MAISLAVAGCFSFGGPQVCPAPPRLDEEIHFDPRCDQTHPACFTPEQLSNLMRIIRRLEGR